VHLDWGGCRLGFSTANAGLAEKGQLFNVKTPKKEEPPVKPNLLQIEVMAIEVITIYSVQLYA
jgi:hypothetical protein